MQKLLQKIKTQCRGNGIEHDVQVIYLHSKSPVVTHQSSINNDCRMVLKKARHLYRPDEINQTSRMRMGFSVKQTSDKNSRARSKSGSWHAGLTTVI